MTGAEKFALGMEADEEEVELATPTGSPPAPPRKMQSLDFEHIGALAAVAEGAHQRARRHLPGQDQRAPPLRPARRPAPLPHRQACMANTTKLHMSCLLDIMSQECPLKPKRVCVKTSAKTMHGKQRDGVAKSFLWERG